MSAAFQSGAFQDDAFQTAGDSGITGTVANAASDTSTSSPAGTQIYVGSVASAVSDSAASSPAGTQVYVGAVGNAASVTLADNINGSPPSTIDGAVASAESDTQVTAVTGNIYTTPASAGGGSSIPLYLYRRNVFGTPQTYGKPPLRKRNAVLVMIGVV
jgi:hypothetical protein